jgi:hypothetical protein
MAVFIHRIQDGQIGKIAIFLLVVEAIADDIFVRNLKAYVVDRHIFFTALRLAQQGADLNGLRFAFLLRPDEMLGRQSGIDNIFDQQHIPSSDIFG